MEETKNTSVEVLTENFGVEENSQEIVTEEYYGGPSKAFVGLVVGGIAAIAVGATVAWKRHKNKKALEANEPAEECDDDYEDEYDEDLPKGVNMPPHLVKEENSEEE